MKKFVCGFYYHDKTAQTQFAAGVFNAESKKELPSVIRAAYPGFEHSVYTREIKH